MTPQQETIKQILLKFPTVSNHALSRMAYKAAPQAFLNLASARSAVRRFRNGDVAKQATKHGESSRYKDSKTDPFGKLPEGKTEFDSWAAMTVQARRTLILSDLHLPYHNKSVLLDAIDYGKKNDVDSIILNGDTNDFFSVSFWEKDPRKRNLANEIETGRIFLQELRAHFPKALIIYKDGNHEERWERYLRVKAPELLGIEDFELEKVLRMEDSNIVHIGDKRPLRLGELNVIHGHEYRFAISNPVNPARGLFLRAKAYSVCGHFHQSSYHTERTVEQNVIATWSTGCLCDLHPEYAVMNNWVHGFAFVEVSENGKFNLQNKVIRSGKIY